MENFKALLNNYNLDQINQELSQFVHSADGYDNRLKLTYALLFLIDESCKLLKTVDLNGFISDIRTRLEDIESQSVSLNEAYGRHLGSNKDISVILTSPNDNKLLTLQTEIEKLLGEYDNEIKGIIKKREELPIETLLKEEQK